MCGIIAYVGKRGAYRILMQGLERLEYRGYDSAGIATLCNNNIFINKSQGRVRNLQTRILPGCLGIGHTRWATHGNPSENNAHPFTDNNNQFALVHNGIIENYLELKEELRKQNVQFSSDTDSEVIVHLISQSYQGNLKKTVFEVVKKLQGSFAFCVFCKNTNEIIGARNGSPLLIGVGKEEYFFSSDVSAIVEHTKEIIYLQDFQVAQIKSDQVKIYDFENNQQNLDIKQIDWDLEQSQKQGYEHFMLKEIFEQPQVVQDSLNVELDNLKKDFSRIIILACGTAYYAGIVGRYLIEKIVKVPVICEIASEFRYKDPLVNKNDLIIAISQSGETADTLAAIRLAQDNGAKTLGIINVVNSTIAREVDDVIYTRAGQEIGVASTKAFLAQLSVLYKLSFYLSNQNFNFSTINEKIKEVLDLNQQIKELAKKYYHHSNFLYIGRNFNYPLALEGALKLKEISYIHAEAYPAGELKHGPIALVSENMPTLAICPKDSVYEKTFSNIKEIKARNGKVITIATIDDKNIAQISDDVIYIPKVDDILYPFIIAVPLQLFAYHIANLRKCDIDMPRNLAKSCTVE
jgi:glutamine---fructose-6-phosphate transaminase (isomerizing)